MELKGKEEPMTTTSQKNKTIYDTPVRKTFNKTEVIDSSITESPITEEIPTGIVSMSLEEAISSNFEIAELQITEEELNKMSTNIKDITEFGNFLESTPDIESGEIYDISDVPLLPTNG